MLLEHGQALDPPSLFTDEWLPEYAASELRRQLSAAGIEDGEIQTTSNGRSYLFSYMDVYPRNIIGTGKMSIIVRCPYFYKWKHHFYEKLTSTKVQNPRWHLGIKSQLCHNSHVALEPRQQVIRV